MRRHGGSLSRDQRAELLELAEGAWPKLASRGRLVLRHFDGLSSQEIAHELGIAAQTVRKWRRRFLQFGVAGLGDRPRAGRPARLPLADLQQMIRKIVEQPPPQGERWSVRRVAKRLGLPKATVGRAWKSIDITGDKTRARAKQGSRRVSKGPRASAMRRGKQGGTPDSNGDVSLRRGLEELR
jgi:DNA-binding CsgD family transcriptional regulator